MKTSKYIFPILQMAFGFWLVVIGDNFYEPWMRIGCILTGFYLIIAGIWYISRQITNLW